MANKKISELDSRASLSLSDLMAVGDPATGYLYKTTISDLKTLTGAGVVSFNGRVGAIVPTEGDYNLTQLGDVIITSVTSGQFLRYNGSNFVNTGLSASDIPDLSATYQPLDADLTAIAALSSTGILKRTGANTWSLLTDNTANWDTAYADRNKWDGGSTGLVAATGRTSLGLVIGTNVQAWDADLDAIAALTGTSGFLKKSAANTWFLDTNTYLTTAAGANTYEPIITAGTTAQYWRGDKSWQTLNTTAVAEGTNLYYTDARARGAISASTGISYNSTTGAISTTITQYTDTLARAAVSLTTIGSSGDATYNSTTGAFNIPNYTLSGLGGEPAIAAGTTAQYWRGDKTWQTLPSYSLPIASATVLGGIKVGSNLSINATTGVLDATYSYSLPISTASVLGGVKIGSGVSVDAAGVISVSTNYQAPLNGTGFIKASGTTISYDNNTYSLDSTVVHLAGTETISGAKTFTAVITNTVSAGENIILNKATGPSIKLNKTNSIAQSWSISADPNFRIYNDTLASDAIYIAYNTNIVTFGANIKLGLIGSGTSTATPFTINLGDSYSNTAGSNLKLRLFEESGGGIYGIGVSGSQMDFNIPTTAQYKFWSGNAVFVNNITAASFIKSGGTSAQYLMADGSVSTGSTSSDTLATVTARGASTTTRTTFIEVGVTKDGSNSVAAGPWFRYTNVGENRQFLTQLNADNGLDYWTYNGTSWMNRITFTNRDNTYLYIGSKTNNGSTNVQALLSIVAPSTSTAYALNLSVAGASVDGRKAVGDRIYITFNYGTDWSATATISSYITDLTTAQTGLKFQRYNGALLDILTLAGNGDVYFEGNDGGFNFYSRSTVKYMQLNQGSSGKVWAMGWHNPANSVGDNFNITYYSAATGWKDRLTIEAGGRMIHYGDGIQVKNAGSSTVGGGSFIALTDNGSTNWSLQQLNASYGHDWWFLTGGAWNVKMTLTNTGTLTAVGDIVAYSDISVKNNIRSIDNALERVIKSRGVLYDRIDSKAKNNIGFIAQELELQFPELINTNDDGTKGVKYQNAVAVLFEAIKEQQKQIDQLKNKN